MCAIQDMKQWKNAMAKDVHMSLPKQLKDANRMQEHVFFVNLEFYDSWLYSILLWPLELFPTLTSLEWPVNMQ